MSSPLKSYPPEAKHRAFRDALIAVMAQHGRDMQADELLAIASHFVGQLIALQDQRVMTPDMAMQIVSLNIQRGNADAIDPLLTQTGGHA